MRFISVTLMVVVLVSVLAESARAQPALGGLFPPVAKVQGVKGAWISPDWLFPGPVSYTEQDVRAAAIQTLDQVQKQGINNIFFETVLRGTTVCPTVTNSGGKLQLAESSMWPVYHPLAFPFRIEDNAVVDTLQIFIEEGKRRGIRVHAWVHMFYWRMDNSDVVPSWKEGRTVWDDMLMAYLQRTKQLLEPKLGSTSKLIVAIDKYREALHSYSGVAMDKILDEAGIVHTHNPLGSLVRDILKAGGEAPDFLLVGRPEDPFPAPKGKILRAVFVDPENSRIQERLFAIVRNIVVSHPDLAGVQLDHIRYQTGPMGMPSELELGSTPMDWFDPDNPILNDRYIKTIAILEHRKEVLKKFVNRMRRYVGGGLQLSCAIIPQYHRERSAGRYRISYYEFICQDWYHWDLDFVVPLMYELPTWQIRTLMTRYREDLENLYGDMIPIRIYPGVSRLQMAQTGLSQEDWVFFDLKLAGDVKMKPLQVDPVTEDEPPPTTPPAVP